MHNQGTLKRLISDLEMEHRDLDNVIEQITKELPFDQLQVQRLKKKAFIKRSVNSFKEPNHSRHHSMINVSYFSIWTRLKSLHHGKNSLRSLPEIWIIHLHLL